MKKYNVLILALAIIVCYSPFISCLWIAVSFFSFLTKGTAFNWWSAAVFLLCTFVKTYLILAKPKSQPETKKRVFSHNEANSLNI